MATFRFYRPEIWYVAVDVTADTLEQAQRDLLHGDPDIVEVDMSDKALQDQSVPDYPILTFLELMGDSDGYIKRNGSNSLTNCGDPTCKVCPSEIAVTESKSPRGRTRQNAVAR